VSACKILHGMSLHYSFKDAAASIRRTTTEYNYQLVIQRAYEEGEELLLESDDEGLDDGMYPCFLAPFPQLTYSPRN
jgi:hypothetical protein